MTNIIIGGGGLFGAGGGNSVASGGGGGGSGYSWTSDHKAVLRAIQTGNLNSLREIACAHYNSIRPNASGSICIIPVQTGGGDQ